VDLHKVSSITIVMGISLRSVSYLRFKMVQLAKK